MLTAELCVVATIFVTAQLSVVVTVFDRVKLCQGEDVMELDIR